jgi:hypothetical protein
VTSSPVQTIPPKDEDIRQRMENYSLDLSRGRRSDARPWAVLDDFNKLLNPLDKAVFWPVVHEEWSGFDAIPHEKFNRMFRRHRWFWSRDFWSGEEREIFDLLPDPLTAYWGGDASRKPTFSWTTDVSVAESFAHGHRWLKHPNPTVHVASVPKSAVCMFIADRREGEIVLFEKPKTSERRPVEMVK